MPAWTQSAVPSTCSVAGTPAARTSSTSRGRSARPGAGACDRAPSLSRSTPSSRRISVSVPRDVAEIASSAARACSGWSSSTCAPTPACTAMTDIEWATTSCSSWAMRSRSSASTLAALWRSASARSSASRTLASVAARRLRKATPSAQTAANWARTPNAPTVSSPGRSPSPSTTIVTHRSASPATAFRERAPRAHRVGEEQRGQREGSLGPADEEVDEDPDRGDRQREQRRSDAGSRSARRSRARSRRARALGSLNPSSSLMSWPNTVAMPTRVKTTASTPSTASGLNDRSRASWRSSQFTARTYRTVPVRRIRPANDRASVSRRTSRGRSRTACKPTISGREGGSLGPRHHLHTGDPTP